jgi:hypothetical protein
MASVAKDAPQPANAMQVAVAYEDQPVLSVRSHGSPPLRSSDGFVIVETGIVSFRFVAREFHVGLD